uniref:Bromo domain-containing protein n=1 Tax=Panagrellus redivivus TaxID=6233 RepID=A0A7E4UQM3_PANRE
MADAAASLPCSSTTPSESATPTIPPLPDLSSTPNLWRHTEIYNLFKQVHLLGYDFSSIASKMRHTDDAGLHPKNFFSATSCEAQFKAVIEATKNDPYHAKFFEQLGSYSERTHADRVYKQYDQYCKTVRSLIKRVVVNAKLKNLLLAFENGDISMEHYPKIESIIDECSKLVEIAATFEQHQRLTKYKNIFEKLIPSGDGAKFKSVAEMRSYLSKLYQDYLIQQDVGDLTLGHIGDMLESPVKKTASETEPESSSKSVSFQTPMEMDEEDVQPPATDRKKKSLIKESPSASDSKKNASPTEGKSKKPPKYDIFERKSATPKTTPTTTPSRQKHGRTSSSNRGDNSPSTSDKSAVFKKPELPAEPVFKKPRLPPPSAKATPPSSKKGKESAVHVDTPRPTSNLKSQLALKAFATANAKAVQKAKTYKSRSGKLVCDTDAQTHLVGVDANPRKVKITSKKAAPPTRVVPGAVKRHFATQTGPMEVSEDYPIRWIDNFTPCQAITTAVVKSCYRSYSRYIRAKTINITTSTHRTIVDPGLRQPVHPVPDVVRLVLEGMIRRDYRILLRHPVRYEVDKYRRRIKCPMDTITIEDLMVAGKVVTLDQMELHAALIYANAVVYGANTVPHYAQLQNHATCRAFQTIRLAERHSGKS